MILDWLNFGQFLRFLYQSKALNLRNTIGIQRSVVFVIENVATWAEAFFQIDRIHKESASLRCQIRKCRHRVTIEHKLRTRKSGKYEGTRILDESVTKEELLDPTNWTKVYHKHSKACTQIGDHTCDKTVHSANCGSKTDGDVTKRMYRSYVIEEKVQFAHKTAANIIEAADLKFETRYSADGQEKSIHSKKYFSRPSKWVEISTSVFLRLRADFYICSHSPWNDRCPVENRFLSQSLRAKVRGGCLDMVPWKWKKK